MRILSFLLVSLLVLVSIAFTFPSYRGNKFRKRHRSRENHHTFEDNDVDENEQDHMITVRSGNDNYVCYNDKISNMCVPIKKYKVSDATRYDCKEESLLISFSRTHKNVTISDHGYLIPNGINNKIIRKKKYSENCRMIKR